MCLDCKNLGPVTLSLPCIRFKLEDRAAGRGAESYLLSCSFFQRKTPQLWAAGKSFVDQCAPVQLSPLCAQQTWAPCPSPAFLGPLAPPSGRFGTPLAPARNQVLVLREAKAGAFATSSGLSGNCTQGCACLKSLSAVSDSDPMGCNPPGSSVHGILQERILEWVAISFFRESSRPRESTWFSCITGRVFTFWAIREDPECLGRVISVPGTWLYVCICVYSDESKKSPPSASALIRALATLSPIVSSSFAVWQLPPSLVTSSTRGGDFRQIFDL